MTYVDIHCRKSPRPRRAHAAPAPSRIRGLWLAIALLSQGALGHAATDTRPDTFASEPSAPQQLFASDDVAPTLNAAAHATRPPLLRATPPPELETEAEAEAARQIVLSNLSRVIPLKAISGADAVDAAPPRQNLSTPSTASSTTLRIALDNLSLRDAVGIAIARHPDIARANAEIVQSTAEINVAKAAWYPRLDYGVRPGYGGGFGTDGDRAGTRASIGVSQLLYDFGRTSSRISAADATLNQKTYQVADTIENVAFSTASSFIELAASQDVIIASKRQVTALQEIRVKILDRVRAGLSLPSDWNLVDLAILRAEAAVLKANTRFNVAAAKLTELIGARPQHVENLAGAITFVRSLGHDDGDIEQTPAILAAAAAVNAADARVHFAEADRFPSISVGANRSVSSGRADATNDTWIGLSVSGNFSLGGLAKHQVAAAQAELRASRESLENQRLITRSVLNAAATEADGATARRESYEKVIALSRASRDLYWQEYMLNKRTLTDVVSPERDIYDAEVEWINARADGILAQVKTYAAVGKFVTLLRQHDGGRP